MNWSSLAFRQNRQRVICAFFIGITGMRTSIQTPKADGYNTTVHFSKQLDFTSTADQAKGFLNSFQLCMEQKDSRYGANLFGGQWGYQSLNQWTQACAALTLKQIHKNQPSGFLAIGCDHILELKSSRMKCSYYRLCANSLQLCIAFAFPLEVFKIFGNNVPSKPFYTSPTFSLELGFSMLFGFCHLGYKLPIHCFPIQPGAASDFEYLSSHGEKICRYKPFFRHEWIVDGRFEVTFPLLFGCLQLTVQLNKLGSFLEIFSSPRLLINVYPGATGNQLSRRMRHPYEMNRSLAELNPVYQYQPHPQSSS